MQAIAISPRPEGACQHIQKLPLESGKTHRVKTPTKQTGEVDKKLLRESIGRRRLARSKGDQQEAVRSSKLIQKELKAIANVTKTTEVTKNCAYSESLGQTVAR